VTVDLAVLALLAIAALAGAIGGAAKQLIGLLAIGAGWLLARRFAPGRALVGLLVFVAASAVVTAVGQIALRHWRGAQGRPGPVDRGLGALLGGAKGALAAWVLLSVLALWGRPLVLGPVRVDPRGSDFATLVARHNLLEVADPGAARALARLLEAARDPAARTRLLRDPAVSRLLADPRIRRLLEAGKGAGLPAEAEEVLGDGELRKLLEKLGDSVGPLPAEAPP
jgi:membrane protein required for colicin V production